LQREPDFSVFFAKELEQLKKFVPVEAQEGLPSYILSAFFGSGIDENHYGSKIFESALEYLGNDASRIDIKNSKATSDLFKSAQKLNKVLSEALRLINGDCDKIMADCEVYYSVNFRRNGGSGADTAELMKSYRELPIKIKDLNFFTSMWLQQRKRSKGRRNMGELYEFVKFCINIYETFNDKERKAAVIYHVGTGKEVELKGDASGFIDICVSMLNRLASEYSYPEFYTKRNVVSVVQSYNKHEITNMEAYKKLVLKGLC
jgi:hypothetical protein